jgi:hypothetical protein
MAVPPSRLVTARSVSRFLAAGSAFTFCGGWIIGGAGAKTAGAVADSGAGHASGDPPACVTPAEGVSCGLDTPPILATGLGRISPAGVMQGATVQRREMAPASDGEQGGGRREQGQGGGRREQGGGRREEGGGRREEGGGSREQGAGSRDRRREQGGGGSGALAHAVAEHRLHGLVLGLRDPQGVRRLHCDLPPDVVTPERLRRRQPGRGIAVTLLQVRPAVRRE